MPICKHGSATGSVAPPTIKWTRPVTRSVLPGLALLVGLCGAANASPFTITTTGTITSGSDPTNILGAGTQLAGDSYTLSIAYQGLGPSFYTDGAGQIAEDFADPILGSVTVTIGSHTLTTTIVANAGPSLLEDTSDIIDSTTGTDAVGDFVYASQDVGSAANFVTFADLQTAVSYLLAAGDSGSDSYSFANAANTKSVNFSGITTSISLQVPEQVPEPATWTLAGSGLLAMAIMRRRRNWSDR